MGDEQLYLKATNELDSGDRDEAVWAKAMALCEGNEDQARYTYISIRVEQYQLEGLDGITVDANDFNRSPEDKRSTAPSHKSNDWLTYPVAPWRRYGARLLDIIINGSVAAGLISIAFYALAPYTAVQVFENNDPIMEILVWTMVTVVASSILSGVIIGFTGSSIGKWIFGIRVTDKNLRPIGVVRGITRDFSVISRGMAFGIPLISLFFLYGSYKDLKAQGNTFWDREQDNVISHRPNGVFQYLLNLVGIVLIIVLQSIARAADQIF